jgi:hypothetical protein
LNFTTGGLAMVTLVTVTFGASAAQAADEAAVGASEFFGTVMSVTAGFPGGPAGPASPPGPGGPIGPWLPHPRERPKMASAIRGMRIFMKPSQMSAVEHHPHCMGRRHRKTHVGTVEA